MKRPEVSIVIPTLNEAHYLKNTLESIKNQKTNLVYEIIIADSYSKDGTREIAKKYGCVIVDSPPGSISRGRHDGCLKAKSQIIVSANADTVYCQEWLELLTKPIREKKSVASLGKLLTSDGNALEEFGCRFLFNPMARISLFMKIPLAYAENLAIDRKIYKKTGGFDTKLVTGEDTDLAKKILKFGNIAYCPNAVARVSMRRVKKWGYPKFIWFHTTNFFNSHFLHKSAEKYEPIRD
ncbi:MAG: glycosyltransferase [Candidatus Micrarchaeota archaeon]